MFNFLKDLNNLFFPEKKEEEEKWQFEYEFKPGENLDMLSTSDNDAEVDSMNIFIKEKNININKLKSYNVEQTKKFEYRPTNLNNFIGQAEAKKKAQTIIKKHNRGMKAHFLVDGIQGHGKTTFVEIIAQELNAKLISRIGKQIDEDNIVDILNEINSSKEHSVMLFIDEFDSMDKKVVKILNPIIESFTIGNKQIKPFIFAGATINKHILIKNNPDTLDRIPIQIKFERYKDNEIKFILKQYKENLYQKEAVNENIFDVISQNCKYNPRRAIALMEEYIVEHNIDTVLDNYNIILNGLTKKDIELLTVLKNSIRPIGAKVLAQKCKLSEAEYITEYEPFLVEYEYINRVPSRILGEKGKQFFELKEVSNE